MDLLKRVFSFKAKSKSFERTLPNSRNINEKLNQDCLLVIFERFTINELIRLSQVCTHWQSIIKGYLFVRRANLILVVGQRNVQVLPGMNLKDLLPAGNLYPTQGGPLFDQRFIKFCLNQLSLQTVEWIARHFPKLQRLDVLLRPAEVEEIYQIIRIFDQFYPQVELEGSKQLRIHSWTYRYRTPTILTVDHTDNETLRAELADKWFVQVY